MRYVLLSHGFYFKIANKWVSSTTFTTLQSPARGAPNAHLSRAESGISPKAPPPPPSFMSELHRCISNEPILEANAAAVKHLATSIFVVHEVENVCRSRKKPSWECPLVAGKPVCLVLHLDLEVAIDVYLVPCEHLLHPRDFVYVPFVALGAPVMAVSKRFSDRIQDRPRRLRAWHGHEGLSGKLDVKPMGPIVS